ncbi:hypothetical protein BDZ85DRAFT_292738 [Elsinoe ampelina]|uniref:Zn(2)-C6 fungal-type domain-containing protein n=1 Tax=Elsinoe ampelina TaxID=302913 RepID=A0A6A6GPZ9_9PEZI|nr:hypothetical protein BDZ85DRAFT_292738 [Elsinoe ampelina]
MTATFKVRTGCRTCKIRKVKCDEVKPHCKRCTSTGRKCDGYDPFPPPRKAPRRIPPKAKTDSSTTHAVLTVRRIAPSTDAVSSRGTTPGTTPSTVAVSRRVTPSTSASPEPAIMFDIPLEHQQWIYHFRDYLAPTLSGRFVNDMWTILLPQLCHCEPAVLLAIASISAGHSRFMYAHRQQKRAKLQAEAYEIDHYNSSIATLRDRKDPVNKDLVSVACCLLFTIFECLYGNRNNAIMHLSHGLQILDQAPHAHWTENAQKILRRFSAQSVLFGNGNSPTTSFWDIVQPALDVTLPDSFPDLNEAQGTLDILISAAIRFVHKYRHTDRDPKHWDKVHEPHDALVKKLRAWEALALPLFWPGKERVLTLLDSNALDLWIRYCAVSAWAQACLRPWEVCIDAYRNEFRDIVESAELLLSMNDTSSGPNYMTAPFIFDHGLVSALYMVALKCRYRDLRSRAMKIMQELPSREGLWDTRLHAKVARRVADIEDAATMASPEYALDPNTLAPENCRVFSIDIWEDDGFVKIHMRPNGHGQPILKWREDLEGLL